MNSSRLDMRRCEQGQLQVAGLSACGLTRPVCQHWVRALCLAACRLSVLISSLKFSSSMLALSRSTRAAPRLSHHTRALFAAAQNAGSPNATTTTEFSDSSNPPDSTADTRPQRRTRNANSSVECMFVYPWDGIRSSAEGLAIARAVQDKYGPAKEVVFPRVRPHL